MNLKSWLREFLKYNCYSIYSFYRQIILRLDYLFFKLFKRVSESLTKKDINKICVFMEKPALGEFVIREPFFRLLKKWKPNLQIDVFMSLKYSPIYNHLNVTVKNFKSLNKNKLKKYDVCFVILPTSIKFIKMAKDAKIKWVIFYGNVFYNGIKGLLFTHKVPAYKFDKKHEFERVMATLKFLPKFRLEKIEPNLDIVKKKKNYFIVNPCGTQLIRRWSPKNWAKVIDYLIEKYNFSAYLTGVKEDFEEGEKIKKLSTYKRNIKNLCGKTGIKELIDLVAESKLVLSVDTGTAHLAAALKIPLIVLFNRVHPSFCKPLGKNVITIYKPVGNLFSPKPNESMKNITVENIITKIKLLNLD